MAYVVRMPQMGMSMEEGHVLEWYVDEGESVDVDEPIVLVESEKATKDVEAREDGVLRHILVPKDTTVEPGDPIGIVAESNESTDQLLSEVDIPDVRDNSSRHDDANDQSGIDDRNTDTPDSVTADSGGDNGNVRATPGARRKANQKGVDLSEVTGTGPQGAITEDDIAEYGPATESATDVRATPGAREVANQHDVDLGTVTGTGPQDVVTEDDVLAHLDEQAARSHDGTTQTISERRTPSDMQSTISDRLHESYRNAVHVTLNRSFDTTPLQSIKDAARRNDVDVSVVDLLIKAIGDTLIEFPEFNAVFEDGEHKLIAEVNVGVAVDVSDGLVTPVVSQTDDRSVEDVRAERQRLVERAQSGELTTDDLAGGTFTISNLGPFGVDHFDPIIDPPQIAILGVGRIRDDDSMTLSLSFDHRVVNGADAARFLESLVTTLTCERSLSAFFDADFAAATPELEARTVHVETDSAYSGRYWTAHGDVAFDEPEEIGGSGSAPSPVDQLLGSLGSCLSLSVQEMARRDDVSIQSLDCVVSGTPEHGPLEAIEAEIQLETDANDDTINRIITKAERACYVARSLTDDLDVSLQWTRHQ